MKRILFLSAVFCLFGLSAFSASTIDGTTGLIMMPTAESLKYKEFDVAADWVLRSTTTNSSAANRALWKYKANIGAFGGLELGFVGQNDREGVFINMKYYLISDNTKYPLKMAIGLNNLTSYTKTNAYMVASKRFNPVVGGHFGFRADLSNGETRTSLLLGLEYFNSEQLAWISDLDGQGSQYLINTGLRYSFHPNALINVSLVNLTNQFVSTDYPGTSLSIGLAWTDFL